MSLFSFTRRKVIFVILSLLLIGTALSVFFINSQQDIRQHAAENNPTVSLASPVTSVTQTGIDSASLVVTRQGGDITKSLAVRYTVSGTANSNKDIDSLSQVVHIAKDETSATIPVKTKKNTTAGGSKSITITLKEDSSYTLSNPSSQTITVHPLPADTAFVPSQNGKQSVIIQLKSSANPGTITNAGGISPNYIYRKAINGFAADLTSKQIADLQENPDVVSVEENRIAQVQAQTVSREEQRIGLPTNPIAKIGTGNTINLDVAVIDTGIDLTHPDLTVAGGKACVSGNTSFADDNGHGTKVSGLIGAKDNGIGVVGMAPGVRLWAAKVADSSGQATWTAMICGIDWVAQNAATIKVANMSMDGTGTDDSCTGSSLHRSVCNLVNAGVTIVVAAANYSQDTGLYVPATYAETIAVGAMVDTDGKPGGLGPTSPYGPDDSYATFSNFGPDVDISAPGYSVTSTTRGGGYGGGSGTSYSSPIVAGAAALYISAHPGSTPAQVRAGLLAGSALPLPIYPNGFVQNRANTPGNMVWLGGSDPNGGITVTPTVTPTSGPSPTSACVSTGGSGGNGTNPPVGILVRPGDGGAAVSCTPGTNGYTVNADNYCTTHTVIITWPATTTATYYKLLIDGVQVQNSSALSFTASGYSVGPQHTITLIAGNSTKGDFSPSTGGYFQIGATACTPTPTLTRTPTPIPPTQTVTPIPPTRTPTPIPPTSTPVPTSTPTIPVPTSTPLPTPTNTPLRKLSLTTHLEAIGIGGNTTPVHPSRSVTLELFTQPTSPAVGTATGTITYNSTTGNFDGLITLPPVADGSYLLRIKSPKYFKALLPGFVTFDATNTNSTIPAPQVTLFVGDVNGDDIADIFDYNIIVDCYSDLLEAKACDDPDKKISADLNDDGRVQGVDINLFLRSIQTRVGG